MAEDLPVTEARKVLADLVVRVAYRGENITLTRHGKAMVVLVSTADFELLQRVKAERRIDLTEGEPGLGAPGREPVAEPMRIAAVYRPGFRS